MLEKIKLQNKQHLIIVLTNKKNKAQELEAPLKKLGYRTIQALSTYEALQQCSQELPHLLISETILNDGDIGELYDKLKQDPLTAKIPIFVHVVKKSPAELKAIQGKQFDYAFVGTYNPQQLIQKVMETIALNPVSVHFKNINGANLEKELALTLSAKIVGRRHNFIVTLSSAELKPHTTLTCEPKNTELEPAVFKSAGNIKSDGLVFSFFPSNDITGKGKTWLNNIPQLPIESESKNLCMIYGIEETEGTHLKRILGFQGITLIIMDSLKELTESILKYKGNIGSIFFYNIAEDELKELLESIKALAPETRPILLRSLAPKEGNKHKNVVETIEQPYSLVSLIERLFLSFERAPSLFEALEESQYVPDEVHFHADANLLALDEQGGFFKSSFPLTRGIRLTCEHPSLSQHWAGQNFIEVTETFQDNRDGTWVVRFHRITKNSKSVYWLKILELLKSNGDDDSDEEENEDEKNESVSTKEQTPADPEKS